MKNSESLQLVKEQLKIKSIELRKVEENNSTVNKKIKSLITENQEEVKKLKFAIVKKDTEIQQKEKEIRSSSDRLKEAQELAKNQAPVGGIDPKVLEKIKEDLNAGKKPYKQQLVGMVLGGKPIEEYAPDFWLVSPENGGDPCGYITSPWYHPEQKRNIAMGYVPYDGTTNANGFPIGSFGQRFKVHLPDQYSEKAGEPVEAEVVPIPFTESHNPNTREVVKG